MFGPNRRVQSPVNRDIKETQLDSKSANGLKEANSRNFLTLVFGLCQNSLTFLGFALIKQKEIILDAPKAFLVLEHLHEIAYRQGMIQIPGIKKRRKKNLS